MTFPNGAEKLVYVKTREWIGEDYDKVIEWSMDRITISYVLDGDITGQEIYDNPNNIFVAEFIGSPKMNIIKINKDQYGE